MYIQGFYMGLYREFLGMIFLYSLLPSPSVSNDTVVMFTFPFLPCLLATRKLKITSNCPNPGLGINYPGPTGFRVPKSLGLGFRVRVQGLGGFRYRLNLPRCLVPQEKSAVIRHLPGKWV